MNKNECNIIEGSIDSKLYFSNKNRNNRSRKDLRRSILPRAVLITLRFPRVTRGNTVAANCPKLEECLACLFSGQGPKGHGNESEI